jgi:hypothetical protein
MTGTNKKKLIVLEVRQQIGEAYLYLFSEDEHLCP